MSSENKFQELLSKEENDLDLKVPRKKKRSRSASRRRSRSKSNARIRKPTVKISQPSNPENEQAFSQRPYQKQDLQSREGTLQSLGNSESIAAVDSRGNNRFQQTNHQRMTANTNQPGASKITLQTNSNNQQQRKYSLISKDGTVDLLKSQHQPPYFQSQNPSHLGDDLQNIRRIDAETIIEEGISHPDITSSYSTSKNYKRGAYTPDKVNNGSKTPGAIRRPKEGVTDIRESIAMLHQSYHGNQLDNVFIEDHSAENGRNPYMQSPPTQADRLEFEGRHQRTFGTLDGIDRIQPDYRDTNTDFQGESVRPSMNNRTGRGGTDRGTRRQSYDNEDIEFYDRGEGPGYPIQLLRVSAEGVIHINGYAMEMLKSVTKKIAVISVCGPYRTGKSFLLNRFADKMYGFALGNTTNPCTEGLWMWGKPIPYDEEIDLILIDSEGLNSFNRDENSDMVLFAITCFLSSAMIYNTMGTIDEKAIQKLGFITNVVEMFEIQKKDRADPKELTHEIAKYFPQFIWSVRDFSLSLFDKSLQREISPKEYLESALLLDSSAHASKKSIRSCIRDYFKERDCFVLPRPINDEKLLRNIEELNYENLKDEFKLKLETMVTSIRNNIKPKIVDNVPIDGTGYCKLLESLVFAMNNNSMPRISSTWQRIVESEMREILYISITKFNTALIELEKQMPIEDKRLFRILYKARIESSKEIDSFKYSSEKCKYLREKFERQVRELEDDFIAKNEEMSKQQCEQLAQNLLGELSKQFRVLETSEMTTGLMMNIFEKLRSNYLNLARGGHKYDFFITKLMNRFMVETDLMINTKFQQLLVEKSQVEIEATVLDTKLQGMADQISQYEDMIDDYKKRADHGYNRQIEVIKDHMNKAKKESQERERMLIRRMENSSKIVNGGAINMDEIRKTNSNFNRLMKEFKKLSDRKHKEKIKVLVEQERLEVEREAIMKANEVREKHKLDIEDLNRKHQMEKMRLQERIKRLEINRQENLSIILQKEGSIRLLQERIKADERLKDSQISHAEIMSQISNNIMSVLSTMQNTARYSDEDEDEEDDNSGRRQGRSGRK